MTLPTIEEFEEQVKLAFAQTGATPIRGKFIHRRDGEAGACALGVFVLDWYRAEDCSDDDMVYSLVSVSFPNDAFRFGVADGWDSRPKTHGPYRSTKDYIHGYQCGQEAWNAVNSTAEILHH